MEKMREVDDVERRVVCKRKAFMAAANLTPVPLSPVSAPLPLNCVPSDLFGFAHLPAHSTWLCDDNETEIPSTLRR